MHTRTRVTCTAAVRSGIYIYIYTHTIDSNNTFNSYSRQNGPLRFQLPVSRTTDTLNWQFPPLLIRVHGSSQAKGACIQTQVQRCVLIRVSCITGREYIKRKHCCCVLIRVPYDIVHHSPGGHQNTSARLCFLSFTHTAAALLLLQWCGVVIMQSQMV